MIKFEYLEANQDRFREEFLAAKPFPHIAVDGLGDEEKLTELYNNIPNIETPSADYVFAKNKFEKSRFLNAASMVALVLLSSELPHENIIKQKRIRYRFFILYLYAYINFPLGTGIFLPKDFAVSIHSSIIISTFFKASICVLPSAAHPANSGTSAINFLFSLLQ